MVAFSLLMLIFLLVILTRIHPVGIPLTHRTELYSSAPKKLRAFVINRDARADRMSRFLAGAGNEKGLDIIRVSATEVRNDEVPPGTGLTRGEVGCFKSHVGIWETMVRSRIGEALIFEDDANLDGLDLVADIERCRRELPSGWNVVFLGLNHFDVEETMNACFLRQKQGSYGAHAYLMNLSGAARALRSFEQRGIEKPVDIFLSSEACECNYYLLRSNKVRAFDYSDTDTQRLR